MSKPVLVLAGSGGPIARHIADLARDRYDVIALTRRVDGNEPSGTRAVSWNPNAAGADDEVGLAALAATLEGAAAVVNLAGASIGDGRMDAEHRRRVRESRLDSTRTLVAAVARCAEPPDVFVQASASGYYGDRGDELLAEDAPPGDDGAITVVAVDWEAASEPVEAHARRVVTRFGLVLAEDAPAWQRLLTPIRWLDAGPLGSGKQWWPWVDADDLARAVLFLIETPEARGAFNVCAPNPVRQKEFMRRVAARLGRTGFVPAPAFALRLVLGRTADLLLLASQRMVPARLQELGFTWRWPELEDELDKLLGE